MEDLFGIVVFVIFAVVSLASRASKMMRRNEQQGPAPAPKWPGPVAGPGVPGFPRPSWPEGPQRQAPPPAPRAQRQQAPKPAPRQWEPGEGLSGGEGVGSGVEGFGMEGPGGTSAEAEARRFTDETDRLGTLAQSTGAPEVVTQPEGVAVDLGGAFADRPSVARAVIMAEVLGKPKGLRRR